MTGAQFIIILVFYIEMKSNLNSMSVKLELMFMVVSMVGTDS